MKRINHLGGLQGNTRCTLVKNLLVFLWSGLMFTTAYAGTPLWTFVPLTTTTIEVPANGTATVQYQVTNQSSRTHTLSLQPLQGVTQTTAGPGLCGNPFVLRGKNACILSLQINGSQLSNPIVQGPVVCQESSATLCYQPDANNILRITQGSEITDAVITVTGSPLTLTVNGSTGQLTINNTSTQVAATNITSDFTGTALDGNVTETGNTCAVVAPNASCTLTYTPGNTVVPQTSFTIQGTNTNALTAAIAIQSGSTLTGINPSSGSASGGTGVTLTGTGLTGATGVTFDGVAATGVNVVNSTTVTAVTPAHVAGVVDVVIATPAGGATLTNGYTYLTTAIGQNADGGVIACLNGGLNNLIAYPADNGTVQWGAGVVIGVTAQSTTNGSTNTSAIVNILGNNGGTPYAAKVCNDLQVDSQGNTTCQAGNICYNDWFLPAGSNLTASGQLNCLYTNRVAIGGFGVADYWSSTENSTDAINSAMAQNFGGVGNQSSVNKGTSLRFRCVRAFTP
ncbi:MAG: IPT/TIG domain-containing protein [Legionella sp.]|nr:IPT/TIG domain-containing protein [Legionella sp.]